MRFFRMVAYMGMAWTAEQNKVLVRVVPVAAGLTVMQIGSSIHQATFTHPTRPVFDPRPDSVHF
jgi:hypothetical protein